MHLMSLIRLFRTCYFQINSKNGSVHLRTTNERLSSWRKTELSFLSHGLCQRLVSSVYKNLQARLISDCVLMVFLVAQLFRSHHVNYTANENWQSRFFFQYSCLTLALRVFKKNFNDYNANACGSWRALCYFVIYHLTKLPKGRRKEKNSLHKLE